MNLNKIKRIAESEKNSKIRAEIWGDFVGWSGRRRGENGMLITQLKKHGCKKILDVALGDGVDTIFLLKRGFDVESNEIDKAFRLKAIENAKKRGLTINPSSFDWRKLSQNYNAGDFDAIICMGNSLTCIFDEKGRKESLKEFYKLLKPGGILIIDERNYQKILDN